MKAAAYIRVSTTEQATAGHSLDAQREIISRYARQRDWELVKTYEDVGISGTRSDRPALQRLLRDAARGHFEVVIVHAIDRFYRNLQGLLKALNHLYQHDVAFISIAENMDFTTPWGKLTLAVLGTLAEIYIDSLSAETRKGKRARAMKGLYNGSLPLGYCRGNCSTCSDPNGLDYCPRFGGPDLKDECPSLPLFVHPIEGVAVKLAYEWYATGNYSDAQIAEKLNNYQHVLPDGTTVHFRSKGRNGRSQPGPFSKDSVRDILQRVFYSGLVPYRAGNNARERRRRPPELFPGRHPPLISQQLFHRCQEVRALMGNHPRRHADYPNRLYLLSGILRCARCKRKMRAQAGNGTRYYQDTTRLQRTGHCDQPMVRADVIEEKVARILMSLQVPADWSEQALAYIRSPQEVEHLKEEEERVKGQLARLRQLFVVGDIGYDEYQREKQFLHHRLADLRGNDYSAIIQAAEQLARFEELWRTLPMLDKKRLLQAHLTAVLIQGETIVAIQPTLVSYPLFQHQETWRRNCGSDGISPISK
ncbi:MAG: recombinase family protein [Anaerolineae bacterium]|nr:recombinase family protein [Anaerolineae bacterium]